MQMTPAEAIDTAQRLMSDAITFLNESLDSGEWSTDYSAEVFEAVVHLMRAKRNLLNELP